MNDSADPAQSRARRWAAARRHGMEIFIVFFGVYAAFLLNRFDTYRRDQRRRMQIVGALEREISGNVRELEANIADAEPALTAFRQKLEKGEMPRLGIIFSSTGYDASDDATLLQAGGLELLDVQSFELLRQVNDIQRTLLSLVHNQFELSLAELANHSSEDFYDPATHQLKPRYTWYPELQSTMLNQAKSLLAAEKALLSHIQAEEQSGSASTR